MYHAGHGVPVNYAEAMRWYRMAAQQGYPRAQHNLGVLYFTGRGVGRDPVRAYIWFDLAAAGGIELARKARGEVEQCITPEQLAESKRVALELADKDRRSP